MKKQFIVLSLLVLSLTACSSGVSQNDYDSLKSDYEALKTENESLKDDYEAALQKIEESGLQLSDESDSSFSKALAFTNSSIMSSSATEARSNGNKLLYITTASGTDPATVGAQVGTLIDQDWFDYDYVLWTQYSENNPLLTIRYERDTEALLYHIWIDDSNSTAAASTPKNSTSSGTKSNNKNSNTEMTLGQKNALNKALSYLNYSAFSYSGLIEQLEYEGFSTEEATYAVDNCGADWNEQAAKKAESYMKYSSFSRSSLIDQLEYEGFTNAQATYGATAVGY